MKMCPRLRASGPRIRNLGRILRFGGAVVVALFAAIPAGCRPKPQISLEIDVPQAVSDATKWIEVGAFGGTSCASLADVLPGGIPPEGAAARLAFDRGSNGPPALGDLPRARYAFAAVAKDAGCGVLAVGCTEVDLASDRSVVIPVNEAHGEGPCPGGSRCFEARCVPGNDNSDPAMGADCSLELVGAGPLGDPLVTIGGLVSSPAIAATASGFLVAYREYDPFGGQARVTFITIDNGGGATADPITVLPDRCPTAQENDAMALAFATENDGLAIVSRAACTPQPAGIDLLHLDDTGTVSESGFEGKVGPRRLLSTAHALAYDPATSDYILALTQDKDAQVVFANGNRLEPGSPISVGGTGAKTGAWVATSNMVRAFLVAGVSSDAPPTLDGGTDAEPTPPNDAGSLGSTLRLQTLGSNEDRTILAMRTPLDTFPGTWGSLAVTGGRVIVVSDGTTASKQIAYRVYEGTGGMRASDGVLVDGPGKVAYADTAIQGDRFFIAAEKASPPGQSNVELFAYTQATTIPVFKRKVSMSSNGRIPTVGGVRDGQIAVAASDTRVAVVWTTANALTDKDAVGGYALFACSSP